MFQLLGRYPLIFVTGPQRSGTTICSKMIASDTKRALVLEEAFGIHSPERLVAMLHTVGKAVIQCPGLCFCIELFSLLYPESLTVFMMRDVKDIQASEKRINWDGESVERQKYAKLVKQRGASARLKYIYWKQQREKIPQKFELLYEGLEAHPGWVPKAQRRNFDPRQTEVR